MAKPKKERAKKPAPPEADGGAKLIGATVLRRLMSEVRRADAQAASAGGEAGQAISEAVKKHGLNAAAFRLAKRMFNTGERDPIKLRAMIDDLTYYCQVLGVHKMAATDLFRDTAAGREAEADSIDDDNVTQFQQPAA